MGTSIITTSKNETLPSKLINSKKSVSLSNNIKPYKMVSSPLTTSTFSNNNGNINSSENLLKTVSPLSPYSEIINDMDSFNSKMNNSLYGFDSNNFNSQSNTFPSTLPFIPNHNHFMGGGIGTPTLSNSSSSISLNYTQDTMDFPSPSDSCILNNDSNEFTTTFDESNKLNKTTSKIDTSFSKKNQMMTTENHDNKNSKKDGTSTVTNDYMIVDDHEKIETGIDIQSENKSKFKTEVPILTTHESILSKENSFPFQDDLTSCLPFKNNILSSELPEYYFNQLNYPFYTPSSFSSSSSFIPSNFNDINTSVNFPSLLNSNHLFNNIIGSVYDHL